MQAKFNLVINTDESDGIGKLAAIADMFLYGEEAQTSGDYFRDALDYLWEQVDAYLTGDNDNIVHQLEEFMAIAARMHRAASHIESIVKEYETKHA